MLDIYGSRDLDGVTNTAAARLTAAKRGGFDASQNLAKDPVLLTDGGRLFTKGQNAHIAYRQLELPGADYRFRGTEPTLLKRVAGWLKKQPL